MLLYQRNTRTSLVILRASFFVLAFLSFILIERGQEGFGYLSIIILVATGLIPVTSITVYNNSVIVKRFFFYGFVPLRYEFKNVRLMRTFEKNELSTISDGWISLLSYLPLLGKFQWLDEKAIAKRNAFLMKIQLSDKELEVVSKAFGIRPETQKAE